MAINIPLSVLEKWSPFSVPIWRGMKTAMTHAEVEKCIAEKQFYTHLCSLKTRTQHAMRIAYLVINKASDAIQIDVGVPELSCHVDWPIQDGHHRLAAAFYRGDETILADVSGSVNYAKEILGIDISNDGK
jgi:hypothetical protein